MSPSSKRELKPKPSPLQTWGEALVQAQVSLLSLGSPQRITWLIPTGHGISLGAQAAQGSPWRAGSTPTAQGTAAPALPEARESQTKSDPGSALQKHI